MTEAVTGGVAALEAEISLLMPMALDLVGTVVDSPGMDLDDYEALTAVVESQSPVLFLALLRTAAGLAHIAEMTGDAVRALAP